MWSLKLCPSIHPSIAPWAAPRHKPSSFIWAWDQHRATVNPEAELKLCIMLLFSNFRHVTHFAQMDHIYSMAHAVNKAGGHCAIGLGLLLLCLSFRLFKQPHHASVFELMITYFYNTIQYNTIEHLYI